MADAEYPGLEIEEDLRVKRFSWMGQLVQYGVLGAVIVFALLGGFGSGPISDARAEATGISVRYARFERLLRPTDVRFDLEAHGGRATLRLARDVLESWEVRSIAPNPVRVSSDAQWITYTFAARDDAQVVMRLVPEAVGSNPLRVSAPGGEMLTLGSFVYP